MGSGSAGATTRSGSGGGGDGRVSGGVGVGAVTARASGGGVLVVAGVAGTSAAVGVADFGVSSVASAGTSAGSGFDVASDFAASSFSLRRRRKKDIPRTETFPGAFTPAGDAHRIVFPPER